MNENRISKREIRVIVHCSYILANCTIFINHLTEDRSYKKTINTITIQINRKRREMEEKWRENLRITIKATNSARISTNIIPYLITIPLLCRFCFKEYNGARICLEGRNQKSPVACIRSIYGTSRGIASMKRRKYPKRISELHNEIQ